MVNFQEARHLTREDVSSREGQFKGSIHQESAEDSAMDISLLRLADEGVFQMGISDQDAISVC